MSPNFVISSFPQPPAPPPPAPQDTSSPASTDVANPPAPTFRQVLDGKSQRPEPQKPDATTEANKSAALQKPGEKSTKPKTDQTDAEAEGTPGAGASAGDGHSSVNGEHAADTAGAHATAGKGSTQAAAGNETDVPAKDVTASSDPATHPGAETQTAPPLPATEQSATPLDEKQKGDGKAKENKAAVTATSTDGSQPTALATTAATVVAAPAQPASQGAAKTDSQAVSQGREQVHVTGSAAGKPAAKSTLRAEQPDQTAKKETGTVKRSATAAATSADPALPATAAPDPAVSSDTTAKSSDHSAAKADLAGFGQQLADATTAQKTTDAPQFTPPQPAAPPSAPTAADFAAANHAQIVNSVHAQLLPNGGSMHIRLDPPDLGAMQITVRMRDGVMSAEFQASNDQTAKLLSHSLGDLKTQLEAQGVTVEKLHVSAAPQESRGSSSSGDSDSQRREQAPSDEQRREQQRKEMLRRMWSKLAGGNAPFDMVA